ncbi:MULTISPECIES: YitT family protein [Gottfriedia]|uniref:Membrane protein n=1 Tax=Gottfriedia solisilvae TaxID=1516104 RepID=A0A8J3F2Z1_9BACI|nr:YitT family protein [Gottfriedia solisilvae]GGI15006.1 membrane protein [Gottfriedia solisilvae]
MERNKELIIKLVVVVIGAFLNAFAMNCFLIPANIYSSGFAGLAQLLANIITVFTPFTATTGILLAILNIPVIILAWKKVGRSFTYFSFLSVGIMTFFLEVLPVDPIFSDDILLNAVFGGLIAAVGIGMTLKFGGSTGGLDIIALVLSRSKGKPVGTYFLLFNAIIVITAGQLFGMEKALYTLINLYVTTRVIDSVHTSHVKLTAMIITTKGEELSKQIHSKLIRGITKMDARGAFTNQDKDVLMIVLSRYELYDLERIIKKVDPKAFTNVVQTVDVLGEFRKM